jgi:hypothetical protein
MGMVDSRDDGLNFDDNNRLPWLETADGQEGTDGESPLKIVFIVVFGLALLAAIAGGKSFEGEGDSAFAASEGQKTGAVLAPRPIGPDAAPQLAIAAPVTPVKTDVAPSNVVMVQLGAFGDSAKAESAWAALNKRFGFLSGVNRKIAEAKVEGGRTVFRLQAITSNSSEAQQLCAKLRVAGENCLIIR